MLVVWLLVALAACEALYDTPTSVQLMPCDLEANRVSNTSLSAATCRDSDLARFINNALASYIHDMGALSKSILDQIVAYRKPGSWLVHRQNHSGSCRTRPADTTTGGHLTWRNLYGCFYHDMQTYVLVLRLY
ncbi:hypothetical protein OSTOST_04074 [Ostertagia ostertagi]